MHSFPVSWPFMITCHTAGANIRLLKSCSPLRRRLRHAGCCVIPHHRLDPRGTAGTDLCRCPDRREPWQDVCGPAATKGFWRLNSLGWHLAWHAFLRGYGTLPRRPSFPVTANVGPGWLQHGSRSVAVCSAGRPLAIVTGNGRLVSTIQDMIRKSPVFVQGS